MRNYVLEFVKKCLICQQAKSTNTPPGGWLQPLSIFHQIWKHITIDFILGLPMSKGFIVIYVVVGMLSKFGHFIPLNTDFNSTVVAEAFIQHIFKLHGIPKSIVSGKGSTFMSKFWKHLLKEMGTTLAMSYAFHPQSDGQTEALNKCLELYLCCFIFKNFKSWLIITLGLILV